MQETKQHHTSIIVEPIETRFAKYHKDNPHVFKHFCKFALRLIASGRDHYSAKGIAEIMRNESDVTGNDEYKINNSHTSFYARLFSSAYPEHKDFFRFKERKQKVCEWNEDDDNDFHTACGENIWRCNAEIASEWSFCPYCGERLEVIAFIGGDD